MRKTYIILGAGGLAIAALLVWQLSPETVAPTAPVVTDLRAPVAPAPDAPVPAPASEVSAVTRKPAPARVAPERPVAKTAKKTEVAETAPPKAEPATPPEALPPPADNEPAAAPIAATEESRAGALIRTFTLIHDHSNGNFEKGNPKATCVGELSIFENEVRFEAPDAQHRFAASWTDVLDTGSNKFFGSGIGGFHVTITADGKYRNFNLAPQSRDKAETKQVLDVLKAHGRKSGRAK